MFVHIIYNIFTIKKKKNTYLIIFSSFCFYVHDSDSDNGNRFNQS